MDKNSIMDNNVEWSCPDCKGKGMIRVPSDESVPMVKLVHCYRCGGSGLLSHQPTLSWFNGIIANIKNRYR